MAETDTATQETQSTETEGQVVEAPPEVTQEEAPAEETQTEGAAGEEGEGKTEPKHKRSGGYQRKIDRLERQNQILMEQLQRVVPQPPPQKPGQEKTPAEQFDELVDRRMAARDAQRQAAAQVAEFQKRVAETRTVHPDWDDVVASVDVPATSALGQAILTSELGPRMLYTLAENPEELARLSALPPLVAARELGKLEAQLASGAPPKATPKLVPRKPTAPAPISPVTARGQTTTKRPEDMSYEEYSSWRKGQSKR